MRVDIEFGVRHSKDQPRHGIASARIKRGKPHTWRGLLSLRDPDDKVIRATRNRLMECVRLIVVLSRTRHNGLSVLFTEFTLIDPGSHIMSHRLSRREFVARSLTAVATTAFLGCQDKTTPKTAAPTNSTSSANTANTEGAPVTHRTEPFKISLAEWSLHRTLREKKLDHLDFALTAKKDYGIEAVEYVNSFFFDKAKDTKYLEEMKKRAGDQGVTSVLIMIDNEGKLGDPDEAKRTKAVENHYKWVEAAKFLGCHAIRVNAASAGTYEEQIKLAADGLRQLTEFGATHEISVIVENHGGLSSNGKWLSEVMRTVKNPRCGTLPDFGNFNISKTEKYDRYEGVAEMMPFAKAVSAKSHDFDADGNETHTDYRKMMKIVLDAGYHGFVGIEYEGEKLSEPEGIHATKKLLEKVLSELKLA